MKKSIIHWLFVESHAKWLFMILAFEYGVAVSLPPTVLTDYPLFAWLVDQLSFIPSIHNFDEVAKYPEVVQFYMTFALTMVIPKSISFYHFLEKNPITEMRQYVITPFTTTKPKHTKQIFAQRMSQEEARRLPTTERSLPSRFFWSFMTLFFAFAMMIGAINMGVGGFIADSYIAEGGALMWFEVSLQLMMVCAIALAVSAFIIKDYIRYFRERLQYK